MQGAVQGAPDHVCDWAVSGCCPGCCARDKGSKAEPEFNVLISIWVYAGVIRKSETCKRENSESSCSREVDACMLDRPENS